MRVPTGKNVPGRERPAEQHPATLTPAEATALAPHVRLWTWRVRLGLPPLPRPPAAVPLREVH
jgi:hypothetical protein